MTHRDRPNSYVRPATHASRRSSPRPSVLQSRSPVLPSRPPAAAAPGELPSGHRAYAAPRRRRQRPRERPRGAIPPPLPSPVPRTALKLLGVDGDRREDTRDPRIRRVNPGGNFSSRSATKDTSANARAARARGFRGQNAVDDAAASATHAASSDFIPEKPKDRSHGGSNARADGGGSTLSPPPPRSTTPASRSIPRLASSQLVATPRGTLAAKSEATSCEISAARSISSAAARVDAFSARRAWARADQGNVTSPSSAPPPPTTMTRRHRRPSDAPVPPPRAKLAAFAQPPAQAKRGRYRRPHVVVVEEVVVGARLVLGGFVGHLRSQAVRLEDPQVVRVERVQGGVRG